MNIIVVGGSRGIGRQLVGHCARAGHNVHYLNRSICSTRDGSVDGAGWIRCDAGSRRQLIEACDELEKVWTHVDALIVCAATHGPIKHALDADAEWLDAFSENVAMTLFPLQVFSPMLRKAPAPVAICFSGGGACNARPSFSSYGCAKTAIVRLVENIAAEEPWLRINAVAPGVFATSLTDEIAKLPDAEEFVADKIAVAAARHDEPQRRAKLTALIDWLLSPESAGVIGRLIAAQYDDWPRFLRARDEAGKLRRIEPCQNHEPTT